MQAVKRFSIEAADFLKAEIREAGGNEVFALGYFEDKDLISRIIVIARGNETSVPVLAGGLEGADVFIHNHPSGFLTPSDNDLVIAARVAEDGVGSYIVDNNVSRIYIIAEPVRRRKSKKLQGERIIAALEPGGLIAGRLPAYELRESQLDLMRLIIRAFNEDALAAAEAGTGVGKSFAYLLPAMHFALANDERIVISTATINLQHQLYDKDIPLVGSVLNKKIKTVLVKGRGNYLCRRRLGDTLDESPQGLLDEPENQAIKAIADWAAVTKTGSRSDLSFLPDESVWSRVCSEPDTCLSMRCPERESCFFMALRRETADARILVVNHHLLFADLAARHDGAGYDSTVVLPPYSRIIIDEAHAVEKTATSFFSREFSRLSLYRQLGRLYRSRRGAKAGLLLRLAALCPLGDKLKDAAELVSEIRLAADALDEAALELCSGEGVFRFTMEKEAFLEEFLFGKLRDFRKRITSLCSLVRDMLEVVPPKNDDNPVLWETKSIIRRVADIGDIVSGCLDFARHGENVVWLERQRRDNRDSWAKFIITPLDVAPSLGEALFEPNKTVVCVSATLTINGSPGRGGGGVAVSNGDGIDEDLHNSFLYWMSKSGFSLASDSLSSEKPDFPRRSLLGQFPSPFPYAQAVLLASPDDAPLPDQADNYRAFVDKAVPRLVELSGGSALVLFTSYDALRSAYAASSEALSDMGILCLKQGDDERSRLLNRFLSEKTSVLFATDSLWEGVDAPGDTLRLVIICRLPFRTPSDPVYEARSEAVEALGGSSFMELSLPEAVMKFKQGFGRLMRSSSDRGVVAVLDNRILKKNYGRFFLGSLPKTKKSFSAFSAILRDVETFLYP